MQFAGASIGLGLNVIRLGFDVRANVRAAKCFSRSRSNMHLESLLKSDTLNKTQKQDLNRVNQNIHRIARKKIVGKTVNTLTTSLGVAAGVIAVAIAFSNPVGAALAVAGLGIALGIGIFQHVRQHSHAQKIKKGYEKVASFQRMAAQQLKEIETKVKADPTQKTALFKKFGIQDDAHFKKLIQAATDPELAKTHVLAKNDRADETIISLARLVNPQQETALNSTTKMTHESFIEKLKSGEKSGEPMETLESNYQRLRSGPTGLLRRLFTSDKAIFRKAQKATVQHLRLSADSVAHAMHDLRTRDENMVVTQLRQLYQTASSESDKKSIAQYFANISVDSSHLGTAEQVLGSHDQDFIAAHNPWSRLMDLSGQTKPPSHISIYYHQT